MPVRERASKNQFVSIRAVYTGPIPINLSVIRSTWDGGSMPDKWECPRRPKQLVGAVMAAMAGFTNPRLSLDLWCGLSPALLFPLPLYLHGWDKKCGEMPFANLGCLCLRLPMPMDARKGVENRNGGCRLSFIQSWPAARRGSKATIR
ncbi:uncharacterized protein B0T23DRAFT_372898 [Neurospora hispaniola]|uniref:Uncharacterized protein n=1 Tax=Neurospora hispaniola TaxID=588809 RepID=A0AAJ0MTE2_9PEZI|nr:hypothetical protein B0T23DRAFT_372898 [Neurospora hispaniola]